LKRYTQTKTKQNKVNTNYTQQLLLAAIAGTSFEVAGVTFRMEEQSQPPLTLSAVQMVRLETGILHPASDTVEVNGKLYPAEDCCETTDGSMALESDCTRVYSGWSGPECRSASYEWYSKEQLEEALDNGEVNFAESRGVYYDGDNVVYCESSNANEHLGDVVEINGEYYFPDDDDIARDVHGDYFIQGDEDYVWLESQREYYPRDETHYCESAGEYEVGDESDCDECNSGNSRINRYHNSPSPHHHRGSSGWLVGFEVEKLSVDGCDEEGDSVEETPLFAGWECDSSCGVEGITHTYDPIDPATCLMFKQAVYASAEYVNGPCGKDCGGHINISNRGLAPYEVFERFRRYAPLWYAVYRFRLLNTYCCSDKPLSRTGDRYAPVRQKDFGIEIRLPNRVHNADVLNRRFDWVGVTCQAMDSNRLFGEYVKDSMPFLKESYGDRKRIALILRTARHFRKWFIDPTYTHPLIERFI